MIKLFSKYLPKLLSLCYNIKMDDENEKIEETTKDPVCPRCGLRSYDEICQNCGTPIVNKTDDEQEDYDWREKHR